MKESFSLVFRGELVPGAELHRVKTNLMSLFRIDETKVEILFSGRSVVLKKGLTLQAANQYRAAMKRAGARVNLVEERATGSGASAAKAKESASGTANQSSFEQWHSEPGAQPQKPAVARQPIEAPEFDLAAVGADLLNAQERPTVTAVEVDISAITLAEPSGALAAPEERQCSTAVVETPSLEVLPVGSDLLRPGERQQAAPREVDLSGLDLAPPGERLAPPRPQPKLAPRVDHIRLQEQPE